MIIGISGKLGSGKDEIGKIIQYLSFEHFPPKKTGGKVSEKPLSIQEH